MSKKVKKSGSKPTTEKVLLATAIINLLISIIGLLMKLAETIG